MKKFANFWRSTITVALFFSPVSVDIIQSVYPGTIINIFERSCSLIHYNPIVTIFVGHNVTNSLYSGCVVPTHDSHVVFRYETWLKLFVATYFPALIFVFALIVEFGRNKFRYNHDRALIAASKAHLTPKLFAAIGISLLLDWLIVYGSFDYSADPNTDSIKMVDFLCACHSIIILIFLGVLYVLIEIFGGRFLAKGRNGIA